MTRLELAKRRHRRRAEEAGAAMFIVAMTLAVLASLGVYALAAASNEVRTSGNERQNTQTHYLAEYGVIGATHEMAASKAQFYLGLMLTSPDATCVSIPPPPANITNAASPIARACRRLGSAELGAPWTGTTITVPYAGQQAYQAGLTPGSFGPVPMKGDFFIELTEPTKAQAASRYATDLQFCFVRMTVTSNGITQPVIAGQPTAVYANEGLEVQRARIIAGPVQCPR
jgi:hypothetical protein